MRHQAIVPPSIPKIKQLVVQVARRLASQARVVAIRRGAAMRAVAGGAGQRALGHVVFEAGGGADSGCCQQHQAEGYQPMCERVLYRSRGHKSVTSMHVSQLNFASRSLFSHAQVSKSLFRAIFGRFRVCFRPLDQKIRARAATDLIVSTSPPRARKPTAHCHEAGHAPPRGGCGAPPARRWPVGLNTAG